MYQRREFLKLATSLAGGYALTAFSGSLAACNVSRRTADPSQNFGLQLYTLRDVMPKDPKGILKQVASFGYKEIESYEGPMGMFWGMSHTDFKKYMDDLGMRIVSSHCDINKDFERKAEQAAAIGMQYLICPWLGPQKTMDDYRRAADTFNQRAEVCRRAGIRFAYHNHDYTFVKLDGQYPQDVMMSITDKELVKYEMDIYWVVAAGEDPITWYERYPNRFTLAHIKDRRKNTPLTEKNASVPLGTGHIDYAKVLKVARDKGLQHYIVEQERYDNDTPIEAVRKNAEFMKSVKA